MFSSLRYRLIFFIISALFVFTSLPLVTSASDDFDDSDEDLSAEIWDPLEPVNRGIFWFNDKLYEYILRPVSEGYDYITPTPIQIAFKNFFRNLDAPLDFFSLNLKKLVNQWPDLF